ncbi:spore coat U domain-containing protein [Acinetobacter baumannii]|uniref:Csu type fimbrial protein n=1 Tax=Acinetobacter calcoaceticus/baumannii complex TaxID=909768 RepID=UPI0022ADE2C5|nr:MULTISPECIES: spore coat U domain-containing protein [Acinetobacter calcoaceticus/baumannii complex]MDH2526517.1 spore coat U domain-containing protein [Acinetobacter baumannii]MDV7432868.1 spore coat U domain-containing protein [Acinetobacter baumannii]MDV8153834.1 spore coat U domain-containing protein [Acinetobacter pittii]HCW3749053.1 spore coat protein U domain-containing protein [Acinetobacter baumannii]
MKYYWLSGFFLGFYSQYLYAADPQTSSSFKVQATIENGCSIDNVEQKIDFGQHSALSNDKIVSNIINTNTTWNIRCTEDLPVNILLDGGENLENKTRRMKNSTSSDYIAYKLYNSSGLTTEYSAGNTYSLPTTSVANHLVNFGVYGVVDLENNNEARATGIYKDTVSIMITW